MVSRRPSEPELSDDTRRVFICVVDPNPRVAMQLLDVLAGEIPLRSAEAPHRLENDPRRHRWVGIVLGPSFDSDEVALEWGRRLRASSMRRPEVLWLSSSPSPESLRAASDLGFLFAFPPPSADAVRPFLDLCNHRRTPGAEDAVKWAAWQLCESAKLTDRQHDVVLALMGNRAACEIASDLGLSEKTVNNHIAEISRRTGLSGGRAIVGAVEEAARRAMTEGLPLFEPTPPEPLDRRALLASLRGDSGSNSR